MNSVDTMNLTIDRDTGMVTFTGIFYDDFRSILNAAALYRRESDVKIEPLIGRSDDETHAQNVEKLAWVLHQRLLIDLIQARMGHAISPQYNTLAVDRIKSAYQVDLNALDGKARDLEATATTVEPDRSQEARAKHLRDIELAVDALRRIS